MLMRFGKYKGCRVDEIPEDYLSWLHENVDLREPLKSAVHRALGFQPVVVPDDRIKSAYRQAAKEFHPDYGGNDLAMAAINRFYELLNEAAGPL